MTTTELIDRLDRTLADRRIAEADRRDEARTRDDLDRLLVDYRAGRRTLVRRRSDRLGA